MICMMGVLKSMFITYLRTDEGRRSCLSEMAFAASENLKAVSDGGISIGAVAMKEQDGEQAGVSADCGFAVGRSMTCCEAFLY